MRIAVIDKKYCRPDKCSKVCARFCPRNRAGDECVKVETKAEIDEIICIGCGICVRKCPFHAIKIENTPEQLKEEPVHQFGKNGFRLFRIPYPVKGQCVGLLGRNGTGKSACLKILSGLIEPSIGFSEMENIFRGTEVQDYLKSLESKHIKASLKPQQIGALAEMYKGKTVKHLFSKTDSPKKAEEYAKSLGIADRLNKKIETLSGGELQAVAIAASLAKSADFFFIDEFSSFLDIKARLSASKLIKTLSAENNMMVVEHDLAVLDYVADIIHIIYGKPGVFGVVSQPKAVGSGINAFLDGYLRDDNVRIRETSIRFSARPEKKMSAGDIMMEYPEMEKSLVDFSLKSEGGSIYAGEVIGMIGPNATGKSTLMKMLAGELKPDKGKIDSGTRISYKPQSLKFEKKAVGEEIFGIPPELARDLMLEHLLDREIADLSGGEQQRVAIAKCLGSDSEMALMDEPSAFVDADERLVLAKLIRRFVETSGKSVFVIDHDLQFVDAVSDRLIVFEGVPGKEGKASAPMGLRQGMNILLSGLGVTFRRDSVSGRARPNKPESVKDREQKIKKEFYYA